MSAHPGIHLWGPVYYPTGASSGHIITDGALFQEVEPRECQETTPALIYPEIGVDLMAVERVAWQANNPWTWWVEGGTAPVIGCIHLALAEARGEPILLTETPASFINAEPDALPVCIVDWEVVPRFALYGVTRVICETERLRRRLLEREREAFKPPFTVEALRAHRRAA